MSVAALDSSGDWKVVREGAAPSAEALRTMLRGDVAPLLELPRATWVVGGAPGGATLCVDARGDVVAVVALEPGIGEREARHQLERAHDELAGRSLLEFMSHCPILGMQHTPGSWLVELAGSGDLVAFDRHVEEQLDSGAVTIVVLVPGPLEEVAIPLAELAATTGARVRCIAVQGLRAGSTRLVESWHVRDAELRRLVDARSGAAGADALLAGIRRDVGNAAVPLADAVLHYLRAFCSETAFRAIGSHVCVEGWLETDEGPRRVLTLDSSGVLVAHLEQLDVVDRQFLGQALEGIVDCHQDRHGGALPDLVRLSLVDDLGDVSLVEQFLGALSDALLGTLCRELASPLVQHLRRTA